MSNFNYVDLDFNSITTQQALLCKEYYRNTIINNEVKFREFFKEGKITVIYYYLDSNEDISSVQSLFPNTDLVIFKDKQVSGNYVKYVIEEYELGVTLLSRHITVYIEGTIDEVYDAAYNINNNNIYFICKTYHHNEDDIFYEFEYDVNDGSFQRLTIYDPHQIYDTDEKTLGPNDIGVGNNYFDFEWSGFEYYQHATPIIPN